MKQANKNPRPYQKGKSLEIHVRLRPEVMEQLRQRAKASERSIVGQVRFLISEALKEEKDEQHRTAD